MAESQKAFGARIARARRLRGWSQASFAEKIDRSATWVSQVERGARNIDRMSVLETLAEALDVPLVELAADSPVVAVKTPVSDDAERLRAVLLTTRSLPQADEQYGEPDMTALSTEVDSVWNLVHAGQYSELPSTLGPLILRLDRACSQAADKARPSDLLASAYHAMAAAFANLGELDPAWIASDRAIDAARSSGDLVSTVASMFRLAIVFQGARRYAYVERVGRDGAEALQDRFEELGVPARSVWGALTLQRAVAAARSNEAERAYFLLEEARTVAETIGEGRNDHHTEFGPLNVAIHEVAVSVDLGDAGRALRVAEAIDAHVLSAERHCRLLIDVARAHSQRRDSAGAIRSLGEAEQYAASIVYGHYFARQIVSDLLALADEPSAELRGLAVRMALLPPKVA